MRNENWIENSSVRLTLTDALKDASASGQAIARFMLANISALPFETSRSVADKVGVSELSVGRFCRSIGYKGFKDLKERLKDDISDSPWLLGDRLKDLQFKSLDKTDELSRSLELEIAAIVRVYEFVHSEAWNRAAERLARARRIFVVGFQTERGLAEAFAHGLRYLRDGVQVVDAEGRRARRADDPDHRSLLRLGRNLCRRGVRGPDGTEPVLGRDIRRVEPDATAAQ